MVEGDVKASKENNIHRPYTHTSILCFCSSVLMIDLIFSTQLWATLGVLAENLLWVPVLSSIKNALSFIFSVGSLYFTLQSPRDICLTFTY